MLRYGDHRGIPGMAIIDNAFKESKFFRINIICIFRKQFSLYYSITEGQNAHMEVFMKVLTLVEQEVSRRSYKGRTRPFEHRFKKNFNYV